MRLKRLSMVSMVCLLLIFSLIVPFPKLPVASAASSITITSHSDGQNVPVGIVRISGDYSGAYDIKLIINGMKLVDVKMNDPDADDIGTWYYDLDTSKYDGNIELVAKGTDSVTRYGVWSSFINLNVDNAAKNIPVVSIASPSDGSSVSETVYVQVSASGRNAISNVQVRINGGAWNTAVLNGSYYVYNWNTAKIGNKTSSIEAKATDSMGNVGKAESTTYVKVGTGTNEPITVVKQDRAMWIWESASYNLFLNAGSRNVLDALAKDTSTFGSEPITTFYIGLNKWGGVDILEDNPASVRSFIAWAHTKGYKVQACISAGTAIPYLGTYTRYHSIAVREMEKIINFNISSATNESFDGVNVDIEPYSLPDFKSAKPSVQIQYLDLLDKMIQRRNAAGYNIPFGPAIARWTDTSVETSSSIPWNGSTKWLSEHTQDISDYIAIMDYRDTADGTAGLIANAQGEIDYANSIGKPNSVVIGVETLDIANGGDPETITFREEGRTYAELELDKVYNAFGSNAAFGGIAMHHYDSIRWLPTVWGPNMKLWASQADTTPPSSVNAKPTASAFDYQRIDISYGRATDDTEIEAYNIYRSTTSGFTPGPENLAGTSRSLSYIDRGLLPDTTYYYKVAAVDVKGNIGPASAETSATTGSTTLTPMIINSMNVSYTGTAGSVNMMIMDKNTGAGIAAKVEGRFTEMGGMYVTGTAGANGTISFSSENLTTKAGKVGFLPRRILANGYYWASAYDNPHAASTEWDTKTYVSADSYVRSGIYANTNYGSGTVLEINDSPNTQAGADNDRLTYMKMNYTDYPGTSTLSAKLYFYVNNTASPAVPVTIQGLTDDSWSESTMTWNTRPSSAGALTIGTVTVSTPGWYSIDVTNYLNGQMTDKIATFRLSDNTTKDRLVSINSKENAQNKAYLIIY